MQAAAPLRSRHSALIPQGEGRQGSIISGRGVVAVNGEATVESTSFIFCYLEIKQAVKYGGIEELIFFSPKDGNRPR